MENLKAAWREVKRKGGKPGGDAVSIEEYERSLTSNLKDLGRTLRTGQYHPHPIRSFYMYKEDGKTRIIGILSVQDRVAQRAFLDIINPLYENRFLPCSFGYRHGKGVDSAIQQVLALHNRGHSWIVDSDIEECYDSIPHALLKRILSRDIRDRQVCRVIALWLAQFSFPGKNGERRGLVQGGVLSPLLSNVYLHQFDQEMASGNRQLVRFADDMVVLCRSKRDAEICLMEMEKIFRNLRLRMNKQKTRIIRFEDGFSFLGKTFLPSRGPMSGNRKTPCREDRSLEAPRGKRPTFETKRRGNHGYSLSRSARGHSKKIR